MNAYGKEGPVPAQLSGDNKRRAAKTAPSLGNMNAYGGEGPTGSIASDSRPSARSRGREAQDDVWHVAAQTFETWVRANKTFPNIDAKGATERDHATWWKNQKQQSSSMSASRYPVFLQLRDLEKEYKGIPETDEWSVMCLRLES